MWTARVFDASPLCWMAEMSLWFGNTPLLLNPGWSYFICVICRKAIIDAFTLPSIWCKHGPCSQQCEDILGDSQPARGRQTDSCLQLGRVTGLWRQAARLMARCWQPSTGCPEGSALGSSYWIINISITFCSNEHDWRMTTVFKTHQWHKRHWPSLDKRWHWGLLTCCPHSLP